MAKKPVEQVRKNIVEMSQQYQTNSIEGKIKLEKPFSEQVIDLSHTFEPPTIRPLTLPLRAPASTKTGRRSRKAKPGEYTNAQAYADLQHTWKVVDAFNQRAITDEDYDKVEKWMLWVLKEEARLQKLLIKEDAGKYSRYIESFKESKKVLVEMKKRLDELNRNIVVATGVLEGFTKLLSVYAPQQA